MSCGGRIYKGDSIIISIPFDVSGYTNLSVDYFTTGDTKITKSEDELTVEDGFIACSFEGHELDILPDGAIRYTITYQVDGEDAVGSTNTPLYLKTPAGYSAQTIDEISEEAYQSGYTSGYQSGYTNGYSDGHTASGASYIVTGTFKVGSSALYFPTGYTHHLFCEGARNVLVDGLPLESQTILNVYSVHEFSFIVDDITEYPFTNKVWYEDEHHLQTNFVAEVYFNFS